MTILGQPSRCGRIARGQSKGGAARMAWGQRCIWKRWGVFRPRVSHTHVLFLVCALLAVVCVRDARPTTDDAPTLSTSRYRSEIGCAQHIRDAALAREWRIRNPRREAKHPRAVRLRAAQEGSIMLHSHLIGAVVALITDSHEHGWPDVRVAHWAFAIAFLAQASNRCSTHRGNGH